MTQAVLLDSGPLGMVSNPGGEPVNRRCREWMDDLLAKSVMVKVPAIVDYELRRELIRGRKKEGIKRLDEVITRTGGLLPFAAGTLQKAAELWAEARHRGKAMAHDNELDGDVILCAQAVLLEEEGYDVEVATGNVKHLSVFTKARQWYVIKARC